MFSCDVYECCGFSSVLQDMCSRFNDRFKSNAKMPGVTNLFLNHIYLDLLIFLPFFFWTTHFWQIEKTISYLLTLVAFRFFQWTRERNDAGRCRGPGDTCPILGTTTGLGVGTTMNDRFWFVWEYPSIPMDHDHFPIFSAYWNGFLGVYSMFRHTRLQVLIRKHLVEGSVS